MNADEIMALEEQYYSGGVRRRPLIMERGEGAFLWDKQGKRYIDCMSAHGWSIVGHSHPRLTKAISDQAGRLIMNAEAIYNEERALWMKELAATMPWPEARMQPCNSGTEGIEGAIKLARSLTGRPGLIALTRAFHGRTMGSLSLTWKKDYRLPFMPLVPEVSHIACGDLQAAKQAIGQNTAAVVVEPVQGEGGIYALPAEYLQGLSALCRQAGALLIVDEIQSGLGRTGKWLAIEHAGVIPDIVVLGKGIGGGIPMGVTTWNASLGAFAPQTHGSTFGGNPLACAASRALLALIKEENLVQRAAELGDWALGRLKRLKNPLIREVRGLGLMIGVDLRIKVTPVLKELADRGVLALPAGNTVLRLLPPLNIRQEDLGKAMDIIEETLHHFEAERETQAG
jgi:LysW-gamma-L-lysine/LysW-L-ornithine aminotransferase